MRRIVRVDADSRGWVARDRGDGARERGDRGGTPMEINSLL